MHTFYSFSAVKTTQLFILACYYALLIFSQKFLQKSGALGYFVKSRVAKLPQSLFHYTGSF